MDVKKIDFIKEFMNSGLSGKYSTKASDVDPQQLKMGIKVEMEHTTNPIVSAKIALDHLTEIPDYYTRLAKMEEDAKKEGMLKHDED